MTSDVSNRRFLSRRQMFFLFVTGVCTGALVVFSLNHVGVLPRGIAKQLASCGFLGTALAGGALSTTHGRWVLAGLCASWFGDLFLLWSGDAFFMAGLGSFLVAHLLYVVAFVQYGVARRAATFSVPFVMALAILVLPSIWPNVPDGLRIPVAVYIVVISVMVVASVGSAARGSLLFGLGAILFYFSDIAVARGAFDVSTFPDYVWGLPLYYCAQSLIAVGAGRQRANIQTPDMGELSA